MHIFVPDTNFFLQCQPAGTLDWGQVTQELEVVLLVVREVRKELDRLKSGGNHRRAKRARAASALIRRLTSEGLKELELRPANPRVVLRISPRPAPSALPPDYPIEAPDERIVAEAYAIREVTGGVTFLSHDSVPLEDAAGLGLRTQVVPEAWLLDPEPSDLDRELGDMKRRMKALEGRVPDIVVELPTDADGTINLLSPYFLPLSDVFVAAAMHAIQKKHPPAEPSGKSLSLSLGVPELVRAEAQRWEQYVDKYAQWLRNVEAALQDAPAFFSDDPRAMRVPLSIANKGHAGAENLIIRVESHGDFHLVDVDALEEDDVPGYFPSSPESPRTSLGGMNPYGGMGISGILRAPSITMSLPKPFIARDRHAVHWEYDDDRRAAQVEGQCMDFRHGLKPYEFELWLERNLIDEKPVNGALSILVSAGNLPEPRQTTHKILIKARIEDTEALIREILKQDLDVEI